MSFLNTNNSIINQRTKNFVKLSDVMSEINNNFINSQENNADKISNEGFSASFSEIASNAP